MENDAPNTVPITAPPKKDQLVENEGKTFKTIQEGKAYILVPPNARTQLDPQAQVNGAAQDGTQAQNVFYNPIQQFNRDLSVLAIMAFGDDLCQRKRLRRAVQKEKAGKRNERKRKRNQKIEEDDGGVKLQKAQDGSPVRAKGEVSGAEQESGNVERQAGEGSSSTGANGTTTIESGPGADKERETAPAVADSTQYDNTVRNGTEANGTFEEAEVNSQSTWRPSFRILDALSATGLRALRYATEIPSATAIVANDRDAHAVRTINLNVLHNKLTDRINTSTGDAQGYMYSVAFPPTNSHGPHHISSKYDVIDLDPYGTAAPFIDAALQALEDGGMLCVTCTDSGVFASCGYSEKAYSLYGGMPVKGPYSHEAGLRLVIHSVATSAARHGISVEPLLSLSIDFYVRIFLRVRKSPAEVKFLAGKTMVVYDCDHGCGAWTTQYLGRHTQQPGKSVQMNWKYTIATGPSADRPCEHCGSKMHIAGPMWGGPLHNPAFIDKMLDDLQDADPAIYQTKARIEGMLDTALDELSVNSDTMDFQQTPSGSTPPIIPQIQPEALDHHPFFWIPSALCKVIKAQAPAENLLKGALRHAGYRVARSHCKPGSVKTDAPWPVVWEIMREWVRQKAPIKEGSLKESSPGWKILQGMRKGDGEANAEGGADAVTGGEANGENDAAEGNAATGSNTPTKRLKVVFDEQLGRDRPGKRLVRYQMNPRENWGPMVRAKGHA